MKKKIAIIINLLLLSVCTFAHDLHYDNIILRHWQINGSKQEIVGSYCYSKNDKVYVENENHGLIAIKKEDLSEKDKSYIYQKTSSIRNLNQISENKIKSEKNNTSVLIILFLVVAIAPIFIHSFVEKSKRKYLYILTLFGTSAIFYGFGKKRLYLLQSTTSPTFIDSAFVPFRPNVHTFWDNNYFHVESKGIPSTHIMMVGISNHGWQQQVPVPQCYIGNNSWSIPLNPIIAANPVPVSPSHFTRGAIAIAANGVPIFNPYTNTGVDALVDGQLDNYGGHCGRADDYHYHTAPLHLYNYTDAKLPIAFALDGFAVYGSVEPDGSPMLSLDANHGHFGGNGVYHYHGTSNFPYMIGKMVGQVTEDATFQIVPQASARPIRPSLTPLNGALITSCMPNAQNNGYNVTYTLNGHTDSVVYNWTPSGVYTFKYYTASGLTTSTYNGFVQCSVPASVRTLSSNNNEAFTIFPNPGNGLVNITLNDLIKVNSISEMSVYSQTGKTVWYTPKYCTTIDISNLSKGVYILRIKAEDNYFTQKDHTAIIFNQLQTLVL